MAIGSNLAANTAFSLWSAASTLLAVPILVRYLGIESYALVGVYLSMQGLLSILDFGLAPATNRQIARNLANGCQTTNANLLATMAPLYWGVAVIIAILAIPAATLLANHWLKISNDTSTVERSLMIIGLVIAARWPATLYQSALMGSQRIVLISGLGIAMITISTGGGLLTVAAVNPSIEWFFLWQLICALTFTQVMRIYAWRVIGNKSTAAKDFQLVRNIWRFSAGMAGVSLTAVLIQQLDKVLLSKWLTLSEFANYMVAVALAAGLYIILTPVFNSVYPRFSTHIANHAMTELRREYRLATRLLCCTLFPIALSGVFFAEDILCLWLGERALASQIAPALAMLLIGATMNGVMHLPYALQLAAGRSRLPFAINVFLISVYLPLGYTLTSRYGLLGGSAASMIQSILYLLLGSHITHKLLMHELSYEWLIKDVLPAAALSALSLVMLKLVLTGATLSAFASTLIAIASAASLTAICFLCFVPVQSLTVIAHHILPTRDSTGS